MAPPLEPPNPAETPSTGSPAASTLINKPLVDDREYRLVELDNGLEALLVRDPGTDKAAAALEVGVGSYMDPEDLPGLAHFLEHLLFMGTAKYPSENEYQQYVSEHAGMTNAYTASEATNYHFEVSWPHLRGALDRFAQFFIAPLFSASGAQREIMAVDSENKKNLQNDTWRLYQLEQSVSNPLHPMHKFSTGNLETLGVRPEERGVDVRARLLDFYGQYYTAGIMKLVVLGRDPLDTLEAWVRESFAAVPNPHPELATTQWPYAAVPPLTAESLDLVIRAKPVMDLNMLTVTFPVPNQQPAHEVQPFRYYVQLIGHESKGSLLHYLKDRGWATELACHGQHIDPGTDYLLVSIELTNDGQAHWFDVVEALFAYIDMVLAAGPQEWVHTELMSLSRAGFLYRQKAKAMPMAVSLASVMHRPIPRERLLDFSVVQRFDADRVRDFGRYLTRANMRVLLVGTNLSGLDRREEWYGTEHSIADLPPVRAVEIPALHLPKRNEFLPNSFDLTKEDELSAAPRKQTRPRLLVNSRELKLWHKLDDTFFHPKASFYLKLANPAVSQSLDDYMRADMLVAMLNDELADYTYYADTAGMHHSLAGIQDGIEIAVNGFSEKLAKLLYVLVDKACNAELRAARFPVVKEQQVRQLRNLGYAMPFAQRALQSTFLFAENVYKYEDRLAALEAVTFDDLVAFTAMLREQGFGVELLILGNVNSKDAREIATTVRSIVPQSAASTTEHARAASYLLPPGSKMYYSKPLVDKANTNNVVDLGFQFGEVSDSRLSTTQTIITQLIKEPAFDQLRTKEQLGYVVTAYKRQLRSTLWLKVAVQTEETGGYAESRIFDFLHTVARPQIAAMSASEYKRNVDAVIAQQLERAKNLNEETEQYWATIVSGYYDFYKRQRTARLAAEISKDEVLAAFDKYVMGPTATHFALHLVAQAAPKPAEDLEAALFRAVHTLVTERQIAIAPADIVSFTQECRGLAPDEALRLLAERLVTVGQTPEEAQRFVADTVRMAQGGERQRRDHAFAGEPIPDEQTFKQSLQKARRAEPVVPLETLSKFEDDEAKL